MSLDFSALKLDKEGPVPLHGQIRDFLNRAIGTGELPEGAALPPETEIVKELGVSRATVRQAIGALVNEGALVRRRGRGTYVEKPKVRDAALQVLAGFHEEMSQQGYDTRTKVLAFGVTRGAPEAAEKLGLPEGARVYELRRTRFVNGEAVLTFVTYLPADRFPGLLAEDLETHSLYERLETRYGCRVDRVERRIEAASADGEEARLLGIPRRAPVFHVTFTGTCRGEKVEYSRTVYRGDRVEFVVELKR